MKFNAHSSLSGFDDEDPQQASHRLLLLNFIMFSYIVKVYYESSLAAILSTKRELYPFDGLDGLYRHKNSYKLILVKDSSAFEQIKVKVIVT